MRPAKLLTRNAFWGLAAIAATSSILMLLRPNSGTQAGFLTVAAAADPEPTPAPQKKEDETALRTFMRKKLEASNSILEGLVIDDMKMVETGADALLEMSKAEKWRASNDMLYRRFSAEFVDSVTDLKEKAKAQSIDGASLAWMGSTMKCLKCHEWVRNTIIAEGKFPGGPDPYRGLKAQK